MENDEPDNVPAPEEEAVPEDTSAPVEAAETNEAANDASPNEPVADAPGEDAFADDALPADNADYAMDGDAEKPEEGETEVHNVREDGMAVEGEGAKHQDDEDASNHDDDEYAQKSIHHDASDAGEGEKEDDTLEKASKDNRCLWMTNKIEDLLDDYKPEEMWKMEHYTWLLDFLKNRDTMKLYIWISDDDDLEFSTSGNPSPTENFQMIYFVKMKVDIPITLHNISEIVHCDSLYGDPLDDLLSKMNSDYLNKFLLDKSWPEGVRKDFTSGLHKFMAALTEASHIAKGRTTLYIPSEDLSDIEAAAKDKDLNQRLESTVIFWTRQIKDVVSNQESQQSNDNSSSPLDEIDFWTTRTNNLDVLYKQLQKPELKKI